MSAAFIILKEIFMCAQMDCDKIREIFMAKRGLHNIDFEAKPEQLTSAKAILDGKDGVFPSNWFWKKRSVMSSTR